MNIFMLDKNPVKIPPMMVDRHIGGKMAVETAQLLSTAHRILDGELYYNKSANERLIKRWRLPDPEKEQLLYKATHHNHPSSVWARKTNNNYNWLYCHFVALCEEYTYRYGKIHKTETLLRKALMSPPTNIPIGPLTPIVPAMDEKFIIKNDPIGSYRRYYAVGKTHLHKWKNRNPPSWILEYQEKYNGTI